jgi:hypothetical protein
MGHAEARTPESGRGSAATARSLSPIFSMWINGVDA